MLMFLLFQVFVGGGGRGLGGRGALLFVFVVAAVLILFIKGTRKEAI